MNAHPRVPSNNQGQPPSPHQPVVWGITGFEESDVGIIHIRQQNLSNLSEWWRYRLSTGEYLGSLTPSQPASEDRFAPAIAYAQLPGKPLVVAHWCVYDPMTIGARISLLNEQGDEIWMTDFPGEYDGFGRNWDRHRDLVQAGIVQLAVEGDEFNFTSFSRGSVIRYAVREAGNNWLVEEVGSREFDEESLLARPSPPVLGEVDVEFLGRFTLDQANAEPTFEFITGFDIDGDGRFGLTTFDRITNRFILIDQDGRRIREHTLMPGGDEPGLQGLRAVWSDSDRWLVYHDGLGMGRAKAWWFDAKTGLLQELPSLRTGSLQSPVPLQEGGFTALTGSGWSITSMLTVFDDTGRIRWRVGLRSPKTITVTTDGHIVALESSPSRLLTYTTDSELISTVSLRQILGRNPNYASGLEADTDGGVILHDFDGSPPISRIRRDGDVRAEFHPRFEDGRLFSIGDVRADAHGNLWTSDSYSLLKLNNDGVVALTIGEQPEDRPLREISAMTIGPDGRIYAVNGGNATVHVFTPEGKLDSILRPEPKDFPIEPGTGSVTVSPDGSIFYYPTRQYGRDTNRGYLRLDKDGNRMGFTGPVLGETSENWLAQPVSGHIWAIGDDSFALMDPDHKLIRRIQRRPNHDWLARILGGAMAADGSLAVIAAPEMYRLMTAPGPVVVCTYDPDGTPVKMISLFEDSEFFRIAYVPPYIVTTESDRLLIYDARTDTPPRRMSLPRIEGIKRPYWTVHRGWAADEVLLRESASLEILRFRLPQP